MRKALILAVAGVFFSTGAMACGWASKSASKATAGEQTVMTDQEHGGQSVAPKATTPQPKG